MTTASSVTRRGRIVGVAAAAFAVVAIGMAVRTVAADSRGLVGSDYLVAVLGVSLAGAVVARGSSTATKIGGALLGLGLAGAALTQGANGAVQPFTRWGSMLAAVAGGMMIVASLRRRTAPSGDVLPPNR